MVCKKCGAQLPDGAGFCDQCGDATENSSNLEINGAERQADNKDAGTDEVSGKRCPVCNAELEPDAAFCGICGHKVEADGMQSETNLSAPDSRCQRCGTELPYGETTCPVCSYVQASAERPAQMPKKRAKWLIPAVICVVLVSVGVTIAWFNLYHSAPVALSRALAKTGAQYASELKKTITENDVLAKISEIGKSPFTVRADIAGSTITYNIDMVKKIISLHLPLASFGYKPNASLYFDESTIALGVENIAFIGFPTKKIGTAANDFALKMNGQPIFDENTVNMLDSFDFSLSQMFNSKKIKQNESIKEIRKEFTNLMKKLIASSDFTKQKGTMTIGDTLQDCEMISVGITNAELYAWLKDELLPWIKQSETFKEYYQNLVTTISQAGSSSLSSYDQFVKDFENSINTIVEENIAFSLNLDFYIHKGLVKKVSLKQESQYANILMEYETPNENYLLNDVRFMADNDMNIMRLNWSGEFIASDKWDIDLVYTDEDKEDGYIYDEESIHIDWDASSNKDGNFILETPSSIFYLTIANRDDDVVFAEPESAFNATLFKLEEELKMPADIIPASEITKKQLDELLVQLEGAR